MEINKNIVFDCVKQTYFFMYSGYPSESSFAYSDIKTILWILLQKVTFSAIHEVHRLLNVQNFRNFYPVCLDFSSI